MYFARVTQCRQGMPDTTAARQEIHYRPPLDHPQSEESVPYSTLAVTYRPRLVRKP